MATFTDVSRIGHGPTPWLLAAAAMAGWRRVIRGHGECGVNDLDRRLPQLQQTLDPHSYSITATRPVYRGGKTLATIRGAEADVRAERAVLFDREQTVLRGAVSAFSDIVRDVATVQLSRNDVLVLQEQATGRGEFT